MDGGWIVGLVGAGADALGDGALELVCRRGHSVDLCFEFVGNSIQLEAQLI